MADVVQQEIEEEVIMPRGDRTGPEGFGPLTGRRMGYCVENDRPGFANINTGYGRGFMGVQGYGRGMGMGFRRGYGRGMGRGYGNFYPENAPNVSEKTVLENEIRTLKDQLSSLEKQLSNVEKES